MVEVRKAERTLRASEEKFSKSFYDLPNPLCICTLEEGDYIEVNEAFAQILGYRRSELIGQNALDTAWFEKSDRDRFIEFLKRDGFVHEMDSVNRCKNGEPVNVLLSAVIIEIDGAPCTLTLMFDITERKKMESAMRESERRLADIINFLPDATLVIDREGRVMAWNKAIEEMTGIKSEAVLGKCNYEHSLPFYGYRRPLLIDMVVEEIEKHKTFSDKYLLLYEDNSVLIAESRVLVLKGKEAVLWGKATPLHNVQGELIGAIETIRDVTERRRVEAELEEAKKAAEEANRLKSQFLASSSHELRTPMNSIMGLTELLMDTPLKEEQQELLNMIHYSSDLLLTVINDLLDFTRIEAGKVAVESVEFNPRFIIENTIKVLLPAAMEKDIQLRSCFDPDLPTALFGDPVRLRQVLLNLANNAIKFMDTGEVRLIIKDGGSSTLGVLLRFEVEDNGPGIPESVSETLFLPFSQGINKRDIKPEGTGLGLYISKHLVEMMGGEIGFYSELGKGSTFWFSIPFRPVPATMESEVGPRLSIAKKPTPRNDSIIEPNQIILLVEDDRLSRRMTSLQLEKLGYGVHSVINGREALEVLANVSYSLILMDCNMPVMDGYQAALTIRKNELGRHQHIPIIALTAYAMEGDRELCLNAGMDDYLTKPIRIEKLKEKLDYWCPLIEPEINRVPSEPSGSLPDTYEVIDNTVFESLNQLQIEGNPNVIKELVDIYLRDTSLRIGLLREAEQRKDLQDIQRIAHSLKSISAMIGANKVSALCKELETSCRDGEIEGLKDKVARIESAYKRVSEALRTMPGQKRDLEGYSDEE